jgi:hypothetical protein
MAARFRTGVGLAALLALLTSSFAAAAGPAPAGAKVVIAGATPAQRHLARLTALRVGGVTLSRITFRSPTRILRNMHVHGTEMVVASHGKDTVRSEWEQQFYVGSYLGLMSRWPKAAIAAAASTHTEGPVGRLRPYEVFGSNPSSKRVGVFDQRLISAAQLAKATVVELRVSALPARAIALTVRVSDPAAFLKHRARSLLNLLARPSIPLLGYYLAAEDSSGQVIWATSQLPGTGSVFTIPNLDSCSPVQHSEPALSQPPPCPAP